MGLRGHAGKASSFAIKDPPTRDVKDLNMSKLIAIALVLWISMYSTYWVCGKLYDYKCDIFNLFKKKKKKRKS